MLRPNEQKVLEFIRHYKQDHEDVSPSLSEMAREFNTSITEINRRLGHMQARGYIHRIPGAHRSIEILDRTIPPAHICPNCGIGLSVSVTGRAA